MLLYRTPCRLMLGGGGLQTGIQISIIDHIVLSSAALKWFVSVHLEVSFGHPKGMHNMEGQGRHNRHGS